MLKTQITGAKYLSPQTNQMTNLNIAIPADSKDTEFGTSDILLAKDVVTYLNALDSDISKELTTQTDKINKINESIKQLIDHNLIKIVTELPTTDIDKNCIYLVPNKDGEGNNVFIEYIYVESKNTFEEVGRIQAKVDLSDYYTKEETDNQIQIAKNSAINIHNEDNTKSIKLDINDTEAGQDYESSVNVNLTDNDSGYIANINALDGFKHITSDKYVTKISGYGFRTGYLRGSNLFANNTSIVFKDEGNKSHICLGSYSDGNYLYIGSDEKFKLLRTTNDEGGVISGIKSLTAFANPSATKVWATDGSTANMPTKFSDLINDAVEITDATNSVTVSSTGITATNGSTTSSGSVKMSTNGEIIDNEYYTCGPIDMCLTSNEGFSARVNAHAGFIHTNEDRMVAVLNGNGLYTYFPYKNNRNWETDLTPAAITMYFNGGTAMQISTGNGEEIYMALGSDEETRFKISRPLNNSEGATITGVKSIKAFSDPSNTKVFATDGSIADLSTKANTSDVLLKKSASGGYYIEENSNELGYGAFATSSHCTASGIFAYAEGAATASGNVAHAEGSATASGNGAHAEGNATASGFYAHAEGGSNAVGEASHAEGVDTYASGYCSHAQGAHNVDDKNAIHSVGIGNSTTRKNAEYIYAKNSENGNLVDDPKNGYKYLIGVGGYDGISTDNTTYKSVQEVIADLTSRIEQLETKVRALEAANTPA